VRLWREIRDDAGGGVDVRSTACAPEYRLTSGVVENRAVTGAVDTRLTLGATSDPDSGTCDVREACEDSE
jgi:hypothetical protein